MIAQFYDKEEQTKLCICVTEKEYLINKKNKIIKNNQFEGIPVIIADYTVMFSYEHEKRKK